MQTENIFYLILLSTAAGLAAFLGALLGHVAENNEKLLSDKMHCAIMSFGGGALLGAVGLVLVPHGLEKQPLWLGTMTFLLGGLAFLWIDRTLQKRGTPISQLIALNLDFIPEAIVLGSLIAGDFKMAVFLAVIIVAQNLPEGFNAYREIRMAHKSFLRRNVLWVMAAVILVGPISAFAGYSVFAMDSAILGSIMTFCAGGILYLVFQDIAPEAHRDGDWKPSFGAVVGFTVALVGYGLTA